MKENSENDHRDGKNKKSLLPLFGCIEKEQAEQDLDELKLLEAKGCAFLSESSLKKEWLRAEEDEAWKEL